MPDRVKWIVPGRVIECTFEGIVTLEQAQAVMQAVYALVEAEGQPPTIDWVFDLSGVEDYAPELRSVGKIQALFREHEWMRWHVVVTDAPHAALHFILVMVGKLYGAQVHFVKSRDEALQFVARQTRTVSLTNELLSL